MSGMQWGAVFFDLDRTLVLGGRWRPGARRCLVRLGQAGLRLGIIANTGTAGRTEAETGLPPNFELALFEEPLIVLSGEVGVAKPDPRIFAVAISRAQLAPERTLFVGHDPLELLAAQRLGMRALRPVHLPRDFETLVETAIADPGCGRLVR